MSENVRAEVAGTCKRASDASEGVLSEMAWTRKNSAVLSAAAVQGHCPH